MALWVPETVLNMIEGLDVSTIETSCCGMAGAFGYGRDTYEFLKKWQKQIFTRG